MSSSCFANYRCAHRVPQQRISCRPFVTFQHDDEHTFQISRMHVWRVNLSFVRFGYDLVKLKAKQRQQSQNGAALSHVGSLGKNAPTTHSVWLLLLIGKNSLLLRRTALFVTALNLQLFGSSQQSFVWNLWISAFVFHFEPSNIRHLCIWPREWVWADDLALSFLRQGWHYPASFFPIRDEVKSIWWVRVHEAQSGNVSILANRFGTASRLHLFCWHTLS